MTTYAVPSVNALFKNRVLKIASGFMLIFACSQITIPIHPVPITLQTLALMLIGLTYGMRDGLAVVISYVLLGSIGLPIFANMTHGIGGPTSGYLIGFIASIYIMNKFKEMVNTHSVLYNIVTCIIGIIPVYLLGIAWLSGFIGFDKAISYGLTPFIIPGVIKSTLLSTSLTFIKNRR